MHKAELRSEINIWSLGIGCSVIDVLILDPEVGVGVTDVFEEGVVLLADEGLAVVAGHVVPVHAVVVEVV